MQRHLRSLAEPIGRHEAGHYVTALALGFRTGDLTLMINDVSGGHAAGSGIELAQPLVSLEDTFQYLKKRVQVLYAGALAQSLEGNKINNGAALEHIDKYGTHDYAKIRELVHLIRNIEYPDDKSEAETQGHLTEICDDLWKRAIALVENDHELIAGLGKRLASEVTQVKVEVRIKKEELLKLPAIIERFGSFSDQV